MASVIAVAAAFLFYKMRRTNKANMFEMKADFLSSRTFMFITTSILSIVNGIAIYYLWNRNTDDKFRFRAKISVAVNLLVLFFVLFQSWKRKTVKNTMKNVVQKIKSTGDAFVKKGQALQQQSQIIQQATPS